MEDLHDLRTNSKHQIENINGEKSKCPGEKDDIYLNNTTVARQQANDVTDKEISRKHHTFSTKVSSQDEPFKTNELAENQSTRLISNSDINSTKIQNCGGNRISPGDKFTSLVEIESNIFYTYPTSKVINMRFENNSKLCHVCGKYFELANSIYGHMKSHEEKKYRCEMCDKLFIRRSYLKTHLKSHAERPYMCNLCGKPFRNQSKLDNHIKVHQKGRHYQCNLCDKNYPTFSTLREHKAARHNKVLKEQSELKTGRGKRIRCKICKILYPDLATLKMHTCSAETEN